MQVVVTHEYHQAYRQLPTKLQKIVDARIELLHSNLAHPSLRIHRHRKARDKNVWICYINKAIRLLFQIKNGSIYLWNVGTHRIEDRINVAHFA